MTLKKWLVITQNNGVMDPFLKDHGVATGKQLRRAERSGPRGAPATSPSATPPRSFRASGSASSFAVENERKITRGVEFNSLQSNKKTHEQH